MAFYHATPSTNVDAIMREGLVPQGTPGRTDLSIVPWYAGFVAAMKDMDLDDITVLAVDLSELIDEMAWRAGHYVTDAVALQKPDDRRWLSYNTWLVPGDDGFGTYIFGQLIAPKYIEPVKLTEHQRDLAVRLFHDAI